MRITILSFLLAANLLAGESFTAPLTAPPVDLDGYFPFQVPATKEPWAQLLVASGLASFCRTTGSAPAIMC